MNNIIEWTIPENYLETIIEQKSMLFKDDGGEWYELMEPDSKIIAAYLTNALMHTFEHTFVPTPGEWPSEQYGGTVFATKFGIYLLKVEFSCQEPLGTDQIYMPQFEGIIFNTKTHEAMKVRVREYDDIVDGLIMFLGKFRSVCNFIDDVVDRFFEEIYPLAADDDKRVYEYWYAGTSVDVDGEWQRKIDEVGGDLPWLCPILRESLQSAEHHFVPEF